MDARKRSLPDEVSTQSPPKRLKSEDESSSTAQPQPESGTPSMVDTTSTSDVPASYRAYEFPTTQAHASYIGRISVPEPVQKLRMRNLPVLDDMANQILDWAEDSTHLDLLTLTDNRSHPLAQAWEMLNYSFEGVKAMYAATGGYLSASSIQSSDPIDADSLRRANLAAAVSNLIDPHPFSFVELQKHFWFLFCPPGSEPRQWHADAFLEITARSYASQIQTQEPMKDVPFDALITPEVQAQIRARLPPMKQSDGSERDRPYVKMLLIRCSEIQRLLARSTPASLHQEYRLNGVLRTLGPKLKADIRPTFHKAHVLQPQMQPASQPPALQPQDTRQPTKSKDDDAQDMLRQAAKAAAAELLNHRQRTGSSASPQPQHNHPFSSPTTEQQGTPGPSAPATPSAALSPSMQQQLEAARAEAATARANARAAATAAVADSQRRPWSAEEENALMHGLEAVKGPHWSQILAMYGSGGTVSEVLKHRNQVQLKDKARNLKLFFLKNGNEVPEYLKHVTGELKTRAPNSAAANGELELGDDGSIEGDVAMDDPFASMAAAAAASLNGEQNDASASIDMADAVKAALAHVKRPPSQGAQQQGNGVPT